jgi:hypothetical protein
MTQALLSVELHRPRRTLKGESIRSLRGSFQKSLTVSSFLTALSSEDDGVLKDKNNINNGEQLEQERVDEVVSKNNNDDTKPTAGVEITVPPSLIPSRRPAHEVRLQFLQNLGIQKQPDATTDSNTILTTTTFEPWGPSYQGFINDDGDDNSDIITYCPLKENRKVQFQPTTQIHPIPSHKVYSNRIKQTIWTGAEELNDNVARNTLEFSYEDWNADNVVDEESGLIWYHGDYVHPVHFHLQPQQPVLSSDEIWRQKCEALGIQPAEYYHSRSSGIAVVPTATSNNDTSTTTT